MASELPTSSLPLQLDLRDWEAVQRVVNEAKANFGAIHSVVYASGPEVDIQYLDTFEAEYFKDVIMTDVVGFFHLCKATIPHLKESKGTITAVSTMATERTVPADAASAVPKAAVNMLVKHVAREYAR